MERLSNELLDAAITSADDTHPYERTVLKFLKELKQYRDAEEQGLLFKSPCKVGDTVYFIAREVLQCEVSSIEFGRSRNSILINYSGKNDLLEYWGTRASLDDIGKTVFFTKEEAEQVLKGGEH